KYMDAFKMNELACETLLGYLTLNDIQLISFYNDLGELSFINHDNDNTLANYEKALEIRLKTLSVNHKELRYVYENLDQIY
ncbi:unnamed protein product, partial [Rotaria sp. Silwood2]